MKHIMKTAKAEMAFEIPQSSYSHSKEVRSSNQIYKSLPGQTQHV